MKYIFDNYALQYMLEQFPKNVLPDIWEKFCDGCNTGEIISERETKEKLTLEAVELETIDWCKTNSSVFHAIGEKESIILNSLMGSKEFNFLDNSQLAERRIPEGLPFILCLAKSQNRHFVYRKNTNVDIIQRVLAVCKKHGIQAIEVEEFLLACK